MKHLLYFPCYFLPEIQAVMIGVLRVKTKAVLISEPVQTSDKKLTHKLTIADGDFVK